MLTKQQMSVARKVYGRCYCRRCATSGKIAGGSERFVKGVYAGIFCSECWALDERSAQQHACEGFEGPCDSQQAEKRAAMTAYHWDGTGPDPNRPRWLCDECWLGYKAHWTEMWAEAGYVIRDQTTNKGV